MNKGSPWRERREQQALRLQAQEGVVAGVAGTSWGTAIWAQAKLLLGAPAWSL